LPEALKTLQQGNIAPVDLAQAAIGPGMAIFSRYSRVLEADGKPMTVRTALGLINVEVEAFLEAQMAEMDAETRFCVAWFRQYGLRAAKYGEADVLARAKNIHLEGLRRAGVLHSQGNEVRLRRRDELDPDWEPGSNGRVTDWEAAQRLILALFGPAGEDGAAALARALGGEQAQRARDLAYRLFDICTQARRAEEALPYNALVASWPAIQKRAAETAETPRNLRLGEGSDEP
jgi:putative DNA methylase